MVIIGRSIIAGGGTGKGLEFTFTGDYTEREDGVVELRSSGALNLPKPQAIDIFAVGGGGKGGVFNTGTVANGYAGGGGGRTALLLNQTLVGTFEIVIGQGATSNSTPSSTTKGGSTSFGSILTAEGGNSAVKDASQGPGYETTGADGGSGSGGGTDTLSDASYGKGGSDGGNGSRGHWGISYVNGGNGQGTTTREFGEGTGKLYAGGGAGGYYFNSQTELPNAIPGGDGGGGAGAVVNVNPNTFRSPVAGEANTGGGGGGGAGNANYRLVEGAAGGSGIVCIRLHKE